MDLCPYEMLNETQHKMAQCEDLRSFNSFVEFQGHGSDRWFAAVSMSRLKFLGSDGCCASGSCTTRRMPRKKKRR